jgi:hypothetical protein
VPSLSRRHVVLNVCLSLELILGKSKVLLELFTKYMDKMEGKSKEEEVELCEGAGD